MSLNRHEDRCCRCGAQAFVAVTMANADNPLLFCGHHYHEHEAKLKEVAVAIINELDAVNVRPSVSASSD